MDYEKRISALEAYQRQQPSMREIMDGLKSAINTIQQQKRTIDQMAKEQEVALVLFNIVCAALDKQMKSESSASEPLQNESPDNSSKLRDLRNRLSILSEETARNGLPTGFNFSEQLKHLF